MRLSREKMLALDDYMVAVQGDVDKFNKYVKNVPIALKARGQTVASGDLLVASSKGTTKILIEN